MKKNKLFCKLLSFLSVTSMIFFGNVGGNLVRATSCEDTIRCFCRDGIRIGAHGRAYLFGKEYTKNCEVLPAFRKKMCTVFKTYVADAFVCVDSSDSDSIDFLYLLLYIYKIILPSDPQEARNAVCRIIFEFRSSSEQANDRMVFHELSRNNADFNVLRSLLGII